LHAKRQAIIKERSKVCGPYQKTLDQAEKSITNIEANLEELNASIASASEAGDNEAIREFSEKIGKLHIKIQTEFEMMEEAESKLSIHQEKFDQELEALS